MKTGAEAKTWRIALALAVALFVVTRTVSAWAFPIFNDEALYLQYAQAIHDDWQKNKFISMGGLYQDWKPPLQYWIAAPFIRIGGDPLYAGRAVALVASLAGLFGFYLFAKELFGRAEGVIAALLYALCPAIAFQNLQFTAETFLFSTTAFFYLAILKGLRHDRQRWVWLALSVAIGTALLLFKQSAVLALALAIFLPTVRLRAANDEERGRGAQWKELLANCSIVAAVVLTAHFFSDLLIPRKFDAVKEHFNSHWVMSTGEVLSLPTDVWRANIAAVADYTRVYYSWAVPIAFGVFCWWACRKRRAPEIALAAMSLAGAVTIIFLLRGFNEYMLNTAVIAVLVPLLGRFAVLAWTFGHTGQRSFARAALLLVGVIGLLAWTARLTLMTLSPGAFVARSTALAIDNYLTGWATGFGVKEVVALLEKEKQPGIIFADPQWGNPRTSLELYSKDRFPNLAVLPMTREFSMQRRRAGFGMTREKPQVFDSLFFQRQRRGSAAYGRRTSNAKCVSNAPR